MSTVTASPTGKKIVQIRRFQIGVNVLVQLAVVFALVVMVNYLSFQHFKRWDFSRDQKHLLSDQTKQVLLNLEKPVKAVIFFNPGVETTRDVMALLREYEYAAKGKLNTEVVDPYVNFSRARELQAQYKFGATENVLILDYGGRNKFVNAADMVEMDNSGAAFGQAPTVKAFKGEQAITSALLELTEDKQHKLYLLTGHGEPELTPEPAGRSEKESIKSLGTYIERQNIKAASLNLGETDKVPDDAGGILILGPKYDLSEREISILREYFDKKGRLLVTLDPARSTPRLATFLTANGIRPQDDRVLRTVAMGPVVGVLKEVAGVIKGGSPATKRLDGIGTQFLGQTQSLQVETPAIGTPVNAVPVIQAAEGFWGETDYGRGDDNPAYYFDPKKDHGPPVSVAIAAEKGAVSGVKVDTARLIVVGNAEFLKDEALTESGLDFTLGVLNWLLNREELVAVAPKERKAFSLNLSEVQIANLSLIVMIVIPGFVALLGLAQWWDRRR